MGQSDSKNRSRSKGSDKGLPQQTIPSSKPGAPTASSAPRTPNPSQAIPSSSKPHVASDRTPGDNVSRPPPLPAASKSPKATPSNVATEPVASSAPTSAVSSENKERQMDTAPPSSSSSVSPGEVLPEIRPIGEGETMAMVETPPCLPGNEKNNHNTESEKRSAELPGAGNKKKGKQQKKKKKELARTQPGSGDPVDPSDLTNGKQQEDQEGERQREAPVILIFKIELTPSQTETLELREGQRLGQAVRAFCRQHGLDIAAVARPLEDYLRAKTPRGLLASGPPSSDKPRRQPKADRPRRAQQEGGKGKRDVQQGGKGGSGRKLRRQERSEKGGDGGPEGGKGGGRGRGDRGKHREQLGADARPHGARETREASGGAGGGAVMGVTSE